MRTVALADIARIHAGGRLRLSGDDFILGGSVPAYGAAGLNGYLDIAEYDHADAVILSSIGARCGKCFLVHGRWTSLANTQVILPDTEQVDARFLWYQLNDESRWHRSGSAQPFIKPSDIKAHRIVLPPLAEQRRIAAILDHADALRTKRRQVLAHLDALTQAIFHDMFAPEDTHPGVPAGTLMPTMRNGLSPATAGTVSASVLTLSAVTQGKFDPHATKTGMFMIDPPEDKRVTAKDFLMCRGNGNRGLVGVGTYSQEDRPDLVFPDTVIAGTVDTALVLMPFLEVAWRRPGVRKRIEAGARTTNGTYKVNQQTLAAVTVPVPPLVNQQEFARRISQIATFRAQVERTTTSDDELFTSLQSRAFRGEL